MDNPSSWSDLEFLGPFDQPFSSVALQSQQKPQKQLPTADVLRHLASDYFSQSETSYPASAQINRVQQSPILQHYPGQTHQPLHHELLPLSTENHNNLPHQVLPSPEVHEALHPIALDGEHIFPVALEDRPTASLTASSTGTGLPEWTETILTDKLPGSANSSSVPMSPNFSPSDVDSAAVGQLTPPAQHSPNFLFSSSQNHRHTLEALRNRVFSIVEEDPSREWARNFVLDTSDHATVQMLTNSSAIAYAVTTNISDTMYEQDGLFNGLFDSTVHINALFVPAFSSGGLTVGVTVNHLDRHQGRPRHREQGVLSSPFKQSCSVTASDFDQSNISTGRYVHELSSGRLLIVKHTKREPRAHPALSLVTFLQAVSSTRVEKINIFCDKKKFLQGRIVDSMNMCVSGFDLRCCPLCSAPPNAGCHCKLPMYTPLHALDFRDNHIIKKYFMGDFLGSCKVISRVGITSSTNTCTPLATFAGIHDAPSGFGTVYMSASLMSSMRLDGYSSGDAKHDDLTSLLQAFALQLSLSDKVSVPAQIGPSPLNSNGPFLMSVAEHRRAVDGCTQQYLDAALGEHQVAHTGNASDMSPVVEVRRDKATAVEMSRSREDSEGVIAVSPYMIHDEVVGDRVFVEGDALQQIAGAIETQNVHPTVEVEPGCLKEIRAMETVDERAARDLCRKERNREAAARSNARRKIRNANLRRELSEVRQTAGSLLSKENELRRENLELRRKIHMLREEGRIHRSA